MTAEKPAFQEPVYLATRPLKVTRDGKIVDIRRDEVIDDFDKWPDGNKRACLSDGSVVMKLPDRALPVSPSRPADPQVVKDLAKPIPPALPPADDIAEDNELDASSLPKLDKFKCPDCDKTFPSQAGLAVHKGRAHGDK